MRLLLILFVVSLIACEVSKTHRIAKTQCEKASFLPLKFSDLIHNKAKYHGTLVETQGYCRFGFERSRLRFDTVSFSWDRDSDYLSYYSDIWLEFGPSVSYKTLDSLNEKFVIVKGLYDTSKHGHIGAYFAEIIDICEIKESTNSRR